MKQYRETYVKINTSHIQNNVSKIIKKYNQYQYYFGVVKADCYGHDGILPVKAIIDGGCNYLVVALLEEGLKIRKQVKNIPILCLGVISEQEIDICIQNNITVTITSFEMALKIVKTNCSGLKVHLKLNTGMNRLGIKKEEELIKTVGLLKEHHIFIEGIYTHIYHAEDKEKTEKQFIKFEEMIQLVKDIPIIHVCASEALVNYPKRNFVNGCRLGIMMYGFTSDKSLELESTFSLHSKVIQINELEENETVGYNGAFKTNKQEKIAVIPIGYADGIIRKNTGRCVYIHNLPYKIVGNICMDLLFVKVDDYVKIGDEVILLKDIKHMEEVAKYLDTIPYEIICSVGKRVPRIYEC